MRPPRIFVALTLVPLVACLAESTYQPVEYRPPEPRNVELAAPEIQLQPFAVRMSKLAHVVGVPVDDPVFDTLNGQRFALGDHDYARALRPDRRWSARKISIWIKGLLPVCASSELRDRYPSLATSPEVFLEAAYGRTADAADLAAVAEGLTAASGPADDEMTVCLSVLSSLEFVTQ